MSTNSFTEHLENICVGCVRSDASATESAVEVAHESLLKSKQKNGNMAKKVRLSKHKEADALKSWCLESLSRNACVLGYLSWRLQATCPCKWAIKMNDLSGLLGSPAWTPHRNRETISLPAPLVRETVQTTSVTQMWFKGEAYLRLI